MTVTNRTAHEWQSVIDSHAAHAGDGRWLEDLVTDIGPRIPEWDLRSAHGWDEWPERETYFPGASSRDIGIDNVGIRLDGSLVAIQCKARSGGTALTFKDLGSFVQSSNADIWTERWVVSNAQFSPNIEEANLRAESRPLKLIDFVTPVRELALEESLGVREDDQLNLMQDEVVSSVLKQLPLHAQKGRSEWNPGEARGHIVLPCGTGKTRIAYRISKELTVGKNSVDKNAGGGG